MFCFLIDSIISYLITYHFSLQIPTTQAFFPIFKHTNIVPYGLCMSSSCYLQCSFPLSSKGSFFQILPQFEYQLFRKLTQCYQSNTLLTQTLAIIQLFYFLQDLLLTGILLFIFLLTLVTNMKTLLSKDLSSSVYCFIPVPKIDTQGIFSVN